MAFVDGSGKIAFVNQMDNFTENSSNVGFTDSISDTKAINGKNDLQDGDGIFNHDSSVSSELRVASTMTVLSKKNNTEIIPAGNEHFSSDRQAAIDEMFAATTAEDILGQFKDSKSAGKQGFKDKKKAFLSKTDLLFGLAKSEKNESTVSDVDDKAITILTYQGRKHSDKASNLESELKAIQKAAKNNDAGRNDATQKEENFNPKQKVAFSTSELRVASTMTALTKKNDTEKVPAGNEHFSSDRQTTIDDMFTTTTAEDILGQFKDSKSAGKQGFKDKKKAFLSKTDLLFGLAKSEKNESTVSDVDDKTITILTYQGRKHSDKASYLKSELKNMQKAAKSGDTVSGGATQKKSSPFMESGYEFIDKSNQFTSPFADRFKLLGKDALGNDIFLPNRKEASQPTALIVKEKFGEADKEENTYKQSDAESGDKFGVTTIQGDENKSSKSVDSYFSKDSDQKRVSDSQPQFTTNEDRYNKANEQRKTTKKEYSEETKKAARITAVSNFLKIKKITQNQLANMSGEVTGDLVKDGAGFLHVITQSLMEAIKIQIKVAIINAISSFVSFLTSIISAIAPYLVVIIAVIIVITSFFGIFTDGVNVPSGNGYTYASLSGEEIDSIIENLYLIYPDMEYEQELLLKYALSKVGCEYNQDYHWSLTDDIFDCSSLAYRSYLEIGIDISSQGIYSAAEECRNVVDTLHLVTGELMPGDLIFYGGSNNGRYMGVYHVAIYVGDGKMVEARGTSWGVVYCDVRTSNTVAYGRYI